MWPSYQKCGSRRLTLREPLWLSWLETFHMHCNVLKYSSIFVLSVKGMTLRAKRLVLREKIDFTRKTFDFTLKQSFITPMAYNSR